MIDYHTTTVTAFRYIPGDGEPMRICKPCCRMLEASKFIGDACLDCHAEIEARFDALKRERMLQYWRDYYQRKKAERMGL